MISCAAVDAAPIGATLCWTGAASCAIVIATGHEVSTVTNSHRHARGHIGKFLQGRERQIGPETIAVSRGGSYVTCAEFVDASAGSLLRMLSSRAVAILTQQRERMEDVAPSVPKQPDRHEKSFEHIT